MSSWETFWTIYGIGVPVAFVIMYFYFGEKDKSGKTEFKKDLLGAFLWSLFSWAITTMMLLDLWLEDGLNW